MAAAVAALPIAAAGAVAANPPLALGGVGDARLPAAPAGAVTVEMLLALPGVFALATGAFLQEEGIPLHQFVADPNNAEMVAMSAKSSSQRKRLFCAYCRSVEATRKLREALPQEYRDLAPANLQVGNVLNPPPLFPPTSAKRASFRYAPSAGWRPRSTQCSCRRVAASISAYPSASHLVKNWVRIFPQCSDIFSTSQPIA
jgi:hypothetical protein